MNPLLEKFETLHQTTPFSIIKNEHFLPALEVCIENAKNNLKKIVESNEAPNFENTILAIEKCDDKLEIVSSIFMNLTSSETSEELQKIAQEFSPKLTSFINGVWLDPKLFARVKDVWENREGLGVKGEDLRLLQKIYKSFTRNGALLNEEEKKKVAEIDSRLSTLSLTFGENSLKEQNDFNLEITEKSRLKGLPEEMMTAAAKKAQGNGKDGEWHFGLDYPTITPFFKYCEDRELRKKMRVAFGRRGYNDNENNNEQILKEIVELRHKRAKILGKNNYAEFVLEERMAKRPEEVRSFLQELLEKAKPAAMRDLEQIKEFALSLNGPKDFEIWDYGFYFEKLKAKLFNIDDEKLRPYFSLENVVDGVFQTAKKLYGLSFRESKDIDVYNPEVKAYEVFDENEKLQAVFYTDFFPRPTKRSGAWMTAYREQYRNESGDRVIPHISIVCNFSRPSEGKPSLLRFNEVTTLFHEFGHALHGMLANTIHRSLSGTNVYWDFVELPSQIMENWAYRPECLELFAKHYETGEMIPMEFVKKIKESSSFHEGIGTMRQLSIGLLDMGWHGQVPDLSKDVGTLEQEFMCPAKVFPVDNETNMSCSFGHVFQGGYAAGYYSYKWAEVLDADAFESFESEGVFNKETAKRFKETVLSKGGTVDPAELYKEFKGKAPSVEPLLRRAGLAN